MNVFFRNREPLENRRVPYNACDVVVHGSYIPDTSGHRFAEIFARSEDLSYLFLAQWDVYSDEPGFRIWRVDMFEKTVKVSERIAGWVDHVEANGGDVVIAYTLDQGSRARKERLLCF